MYCIDVLTDKAQSGREYTEYILNCCAERNIFPLVQIYYDQEKFFAQIQKTVPAIVLLILPGVKGLNAAEHLRSLYRDAGSSGAVTLIFPFMHSDCVWNISSWNR